MEQSTNSVQDSHGQYWLVVACCLLKGFFFCFFLVWCLWMLALLGFVACLVEMPISSCNSEQAHCWVNGSFLVLLLVVQFLSDLSCQRLLLAHLPSLLLSSVSRLDNQPMMRKRFGFDTLSSMPSLQIPANTVVGCCLFKCCPDQGIGVHWNHSGRWLLPVKLWRMPCISNPSIDADAGKMMRVRSPCLHAPAP